MSDKPNNPPAFPRSCHEGETFTDEGADGMTLRDWFAGQALAGMHLPHDYSTGPCNSAAAERCYAVADAMLKAREAKP